MIIVLAVQAKIRIVQIVTDLETHHIPLLEAEEKREATVMEGKKDLTLATSLIAKVDGDPLLPILIAPTHLVKAIRPVQERLQNQNIEEKRN
jgi:hypothetical protein